MEKRTGEIEQMLKENKKLALEKLVGKVQEIKVTKPWEKRKEGGRMEKEKTKCHLCGGKAVLEFEELKLGEGKITIQDSPYYECKKCKEKFATSEQMKELDAQIHFGPQILEAKLK